MRCRDNIATVTREVCLMITLSARPESLTFPAQNSAR